MTPRLAVPAWGAASWVACPYWPTALQHSKDEETPDRILGKCAHWVASRLLNGEAIALGQPIPGYIGQEVTQEMMTAARVFVDDVASTMRGQPIYVEQPLTMIDRLAPVGTVKPDVFGWVTDDQVNVYEFKMGREFVQAFSNWQMLLYARAILDVWNVDGWREQGITVCFRVVQPRNYDREGPVREWKIKASELRALWNILGNAAEEATNPNPVARTGTTQCKRCPGRARCSTFQRHAYAEASHVGDGMPFDLDGNALGLELRALEDARAILDARITGLEQEAAAKISKGETVTGYAMESGLSRQYWTIPDHAVSTLGALYGVKTTVEKPITPTQATEAGLPVEFVNQYSTRSRTEEKLIRVENSKVRKAFGLN